MKRIKTALEMVKKDASPFTNPLAGYGFLAFAGFGFFSWVNSGTLAMVFGWLSMAGIGAMWGAILIDLVVFLAALTMAEAVRQKRDELAAANEKLDEWRIARNLALAENIKLAQDIRAYGDMNSIADGLDLGHDDREKN